MAPSRSSKADVIALGEHLEAKVGSIRPRQGATGGVGSARPPSEPVTAAAGAAAAGAAGRQRRPEPWHPHRTNFARKFCIDRLNIDRSRLHFWIFLEFGGYCFGYLVDNTLYLITSMPKQLR